MTENKVDIYWFKVISATNRHYLSVFLGALVNLCKLIFIVLFFIAVFAEWFIDSFPLISKCFESVDDGLEMA